MNFVTTVEYTLQSNLHATPPPKKNNNKYLSISSEEIHTNVQNYNF